jgi:hypothetical protein
MGEHRRSGSAAAPSGDAIGFRICRMTALDAGGARPSRSTTSVGGAQRSTAEWVDPLNAAGVPCGPVY